MPAALPTDEIILTNGKVLEVDKIKTETYAEVTYKKNGREGSKASDEIAELIHDLSASVLDDYASALETMELGEFSAAARRLTGVLEDKRVVDSSRYAWVKQHAMFKKAQCISALADYKGTVSAIDELLLAVPGSYYYAPALMLKAESLKASGDNSGAEKIFKQLGDGVESKGLPARWGRESELGLLILDRALSGDAKQRALTGLAEKNAREYPTVAARARVEVGNAMIAAKNYSAANDFFRAIVDSGSADAGTEAAAYAGLGDCAYQRGLANEDLMAANLDYEEAALRHLYVATMHKSATRLVPRSLYVAAAALNRMGRKKDAKSLASRLNKTYPRSTWTTKVKKELNLR
ncbi:MAG: hypothetical protein HN961_04865 [Planctomycetes bacterium]|nr:hypothetical protein [Planctomycetota bacterium]